jgi:PPOX class probable FMN-dependent enzyme
MNENMVKKIVDQDELSELYPSPGSRALGKVLVKLDSYCIRFIKLSPFCLISTVDKNGLPEISPRGGPPGFVGVYDESTLMLPDRPGNNRLDSLSNLLTSPSLAFLFLVPGIDETLRTYGTAELLADDELTRSFMENNRPPKTVMKIMVRKAYFQCAKSLMRARLWDESSKVDRKSFPTLGEILKDELGTSGAAESQEQMLRRYEEAL